MLGNVTGFSYSLTKVRSLMILCGRHFHNPCAWDGVSVPVGVQVGTCLCLPLKVILLSTIFVLVMRLQADLPLP